MAFFKLKRPHSPHNSSDAIGISNYKRIRLIEDFERLSLGGNVSYDRDAYTRDMGSSVTKVVDTQINLPKSVKNKLIREELNQQDSGHATADEIIYSKIRDWIREDAMQIVRWVDWKTLLYEQWLKWFQTLYWNQRSNTLPHVFDNEGDYDIDNPSLYMFDRNSVNNQNYTNYIDTMDTDVDMDA
ncbi:hypothetical protein MOUN0_O03620 [Monosporozyma unispora]|nr:hypothetical protein C6P44_002925 [Kazachstania unispora]